jgi:hypothetical protein
LDESGHLIENYEATITAQENLLKGLQSSLDELSAIYRTQVPLSAKYEKSSRF